MSDSDGQPGVSVLKASAIPELRPPTPDPRPLQGTARHAFLLVAATVIVAVLNYALNIILGWTLTVEEYGRVGVSQTLIFVLVWFLGAGFPWVVTRALARTRGATAPTLRKMPGRGAPTRPRG